MKTYEPSGLLDAFRRLDPPLIATDVHDVEARMRLLHQEGMSYESADRVERIYQPGSPSRHKAQDERAVDFARHYRDGQNQTSPRTWDDWPFEAEGESVE